MDSAAFRGDAAFSAVWMVEKIIENMHKNSNEFLEIFAENVCFTKILVKNN